MTAQTENLEFVNIEGLLSYGQAIAMRPPMEGAETPLLRQHQ
ncbi:MAG: hypothetical protein R3B74_00570 [Nitrospirales bacterium]